MANLKISEMQQVAAPTAADFLYVVQGGISSNMTVGALAKNLPDACLQGILQLASTETTSTNGGALIDTSIVGALVVDNVDRAFSIDMPTTNFMLKAIYLKASGGGKAIISGSLIAGITNITLSTPGSGAILMSTATGWAVLATTGVMNHV